ncbi:ribonuclease E activity regulator RraA [Chelativorans sp. YIM 93263]|uniref:ribonuclease E activity regulator RraA n=1 Tax=Chelativorans sp. YIM 93263 TaxID=2906648 RepID=UPI0023788FC2|nr:ribonuclease E activity regulator RraA [Chelativorans sp. YIM 93263]
MAVLKTADLIDDHDEKLRFCNHPLVLFGGSGGFHGPVVTVKCFEDNALLRSVLEEPGEGRALVVDGGGSTRCAVVGDKIAKLAQDNGWAGVVINGAIRDSEEIDEMDFAIFALATSPKKSAKQKTGARDVPVTFGDLTFEPGHYLYADADGILVADGPVHGG